MREKLPSRRKNATQRLKIGKQTVHFTVGMYPDGRPGELFIDMHKRGTAVNAWCSSTSKLVSLMLQYGVPLSELVDALAGQCTEPWGKVSVSGHPIVTEASGVLDAVIRIMALDYLANECAQDSQKQIAKQMQGFLAMTEALGEAEICEIAESIGIEPKLSAFLAKFS